MDLPNPIPPHLERGIRRARQIEHDVVARLDKMRETAEQRDVQGELTKAAKNARQALQNPDLSTTSLGVALKGMAKVRAQLMDEAEQADIALVRAAAAYEEAQVALQWHEMRRGLFEERAQLTKSRKRELSADQVSPEEMAFLLEMRARGVPTSALDQGNSHERDFIAFFLRDLAKPIDERKPTGAWARTFSEGHLNMPVRSMSDDEAEALRIVWSRGYDAAAEAKAALEDLAGRPLDISPNFARMIIGAQEHYDLGQVPGLKQNVKTAEQLAWRQDVAKILQSLGLAENDVERARAILRGEPSGAALVPDSVPLEQEPSSTSMSAPATETAMAQAPSTVPTPAPTQVPAPFPVLKPEPRPAQSSMPVTASPPAVQTLPSALNAYPEPAATLPIGTIEPVCTADAPERTGSTSTAIFSTLISDTAPPAASPRIIGSKSSVPPPLDASPVAKPVETPVPTPAEGAGASQIISESADQAYLRIAEHEGKSARRKLLELVGLPSDVTDEARICQSVFEAYQRKVSGRYVLQLHAAASARQAVAFLERLERGHSAKVYERLRTDGAYRAKLRRAGLPITEPGISDVTQERDLSFKDISAPRNTEFD